LTGGIPVRWIVVGIFVLSSALNYLDRQVLAAVAPVLKIEFGISNEQYGRILQLFSLTYALSSPVAGWLLDRFGLNRGITFAVALWSIAGMARGFVAGLPGLMAATAVLGVGESAGIPSTGKVGHKYLQPKERALGAGFSQIGLSIGSVAAPLMAAYFDWRLAFIVTGALGFVWIPVWLAASKWAPASEDAQTAAPLAMKDMLSDRRLWGYVASNLLAMTVYSLWTNWTSVFLTHQFKLSVDDIKFLAGLPHLAAYFGALIGGAISWRLISRGMPPLTARRYALLACAVMMSSTVLVPLMPTPLTAALMIAFSFFWSSGWGVNLYTMPVDAFGARAAFGVSLLTAAYGLLQVIVSPLIGRTIDQYGFGPVCTVAAFMPLAGYAIVHLTRRDD